MSRLNLSDRYIGYEKTPEAEDHDPLSSGEDGSHSEQQERGRCAKLSIAITMLLVWTLLAYYIGYQDGKAGHPQLPTHAITKDAVHLQLQLLDDEFDVRFPENKAFKGQPRAELDEAWSRLIDGLNFRVPRQTAERIGFDSLELADGSGDRFASMAVIHNLHCLKRIRESLFPMRYPESWEMNRPVDGQISPHMDHCIDNLRQALMCNADVTLYRYHWQNSTRRPKPTVMSPHICVDWTRLQSWLDGYKFSIHDHLLVHPTLGSGS